MKDFAYRTLSAFIPILGFIASFWLIYNVETRFMPVIQDFTVDYVVKNPDGSFTAGGTLLKSRPCEFIGLTLYGTHGDDPKLIVGQYKKDIFGADVGQGLQTWGPWSMSLPGALMNMDKLQVMGTHRCHALWLQTTIYTEFDIRRLPK